MKKEHGYIDVEIVIGLLGLIAVILVFLTFLFARIATSEHTVSGVVYNNSNNAFVSGNTRFSVRASENTVVTEENKSSYCLPPNSPYIELVNEAAKDKSIKVIVTTEKAFTFVPTPWTCIDNVKVELQKEVLR